MKRALLALGLIVPVWILAAGCSGDDDASSGGVVCTEIGCQDAVTFKLGDLAASFEMSLPIVVEACVDGTICSKFKVDAQAGSAAVCEPEPGTSAGCAVDAGGNVEIQQSVSSFKDPQGSHTMSVSIRDAQDTVVFDETKPVTLSAVQPNGAACPPTCHQGTVEIQPSP